MGDHSYQCVNKGCSNGHMSTFLGAPPEWFAGKGISEPKNCPNCRDWRKSQTDTASRCQECGYTIQQRSGAKRAFHRHQGPYETPTRCRQCLEGQRPLTSLERRPPRPDRLRSRPRTTLDTVSYDELSEYRKEHFGKHISGHPYSEVGQVMNDGRVVSATTLVGPDASSVEMFFAGKAIAERTDLDVYQFHRNGDIVIKATIVDGTHVEKTVFRKHDDGRHEFITSYDQIPITEARLWR